MGGDKANLTAPRGQWCDRLEYLIQLFMKRRFVDGDIPLHPANVARITGQRLDLKSAGEVHDERQNVLVFVGDHFLADFFRGCIKRFRPHRHGVDKFAGHLLIRTDVKVIAPAVFLLQ
ncbi:Uncharacterised protein [Shigella sonnei]|nr:Uncharacterised protein [Shigella sonnei]